MKEKFINKKTIKRIIFVILGTILIITLFGCANAQTSEYGTEIISPDFTFTDNYMYDFETGHPRDNINYAISSRELYNSESLTLNDYNYTSYIFFWDRQNRFLGYYTTTGSINTYDTYLGNVGNTFDVPENTLKIAFMVNKNGEDGYFRLGENLYTEETLDYIYRNPIMDDYVIYDAIDDYIDIEGYEHLTYRDVFGDSLYGTGKTNLIDNGDFSDGANDWNSSGAITIDFSNNQLLIESTSDSQNGYVQQVYNYIANDIIYYGADIITYSNLIGLTYGQISGSFVYSSGTGELENISTYFDFSSNSTSFFRIYVASTSALNAQAIVDNVLLFNITDIFGAGNEPTKEQFEEMLEQYKEIMYYSEGDGEITLGDIGQVMRFNLQNWYNNGANFLTEMGNANSTYGYDIDTYSYDNLISNGDFYDDIEGWAGTNANIILSNGTLKISPLLSGGYARTSIYDIILDNTYYMNLDLKTNSLINDVGVGFAGLSSILNLTSNEFINYSSLYTSSFNASSTTFRIINREGELFDIFSDNINLFDLDNTYWTNLKTANSWDNYDLKTLIDNQLTYYTYIDESISYLPDYESTDFNTYYNLHLVNDVAKQNEIVVIRKWYNNSQTLFNMDLEIEEYQEFIPVGYDFNTENIDKTIKYFSENYRVSDGTSMEYGEEYFNNEFIVNPLFFQEAFEKVDYNVRDIFNAFNSFREETIDLYWDSQNLIDRWEWYINYGIGEHNYLDLLEEISLQQLETTTTSFADLQLIDTSGTNYITTYTFDIQTWIDNTIDGFGFETDYMYISISLMLITGTLIIMILSKASKTMILIMMFLELMFFISQTWVDSWIILIMLALGFISVLLRYLRRE